MKGKQTELSRKQPPFPELKSISQTTSKDSEEDQTPEPLLELLLKNQIKVERIIQEIGKRQLKFEDKPVLCGSIVKFHAVTKFEENCQSFTQVKQYTLDLYSLYKKVARALPDNPEDEGSFNLRLRFVTVVEKILEQLQTEQTFKKYSSLIHYGHILTYTNFNRFSNQEVYQLFVMHFKNFSTDPEIFQAQLDVLIDAVAALEEDRRVITKLKQITLRADLIQNWILYSKQAIREYLRLDKGDRDRINQEDVVLLNLYAIEVVLSAPGSKSYDDLFSNLKSLIRIYIKNDKSDLNIMRAMITVTECIMKSQTTTAGFEKRFGWLLPLAQRIIASNPSKEDSPEWQEFESKLSKFSDFMSRPKPQPLEIKAPKPAPVSKPAKVEKDDQVLKLKKELEEIQAREQKQRDEQRSKHQKAIQQLKSKISSLEQTVEENITAKQKAGEVSNSQALEIEELQAELAKVKLETKAAQTALVTAKRTIQTLRGQEQLHTKEKQAGIAKAKRQEEVISELQEDSKKHRLELSLLKTRFTSRESEFQVEEEKTAGTLQSLQEQIAQYAKKIAEQEQTIKTVKEFNQVVQQQKDQALQLMQQSQTHNTELVEELAATKVALQKRELDLAGERESHEAEKAQADVVQTQLAENSLWLQQLLDTQAQRAQSAEAECKAAGKREGQLLAALERAAVQVEPPQTAVGYGTDGSVIVISKIAQPVSVSSSVSQFGTPFATIPVVSMPTARTSVSGYPYAGFQYGRSGRRAAPGQQQQDFTIK